MTRPRAHVPTRPRAHVPTQALTRCSRTDAAGVAVAFTTFDKDSSGTIDEDEFMDLTRTINNANPMFPQNFKRALEEFDKNDDGPVVDLGGSLDSPPPWGVRWRCECVAVCLRHRHCTGSARGTCVAPAARPAARLARQADRLRRVPDDQPVLPDGALPGVPDAGVHAEALPRSVPAPRRTYAW